MTGCAGVAPTQAVINLADQRPPAGQADDAAPSDGGSVISTAIDPNLRITAPVFVNGKGPYDFIVDTGANISVLTNDLAMELLIPPGPLVLVHGIAGSFYAPTVCVSMLTVGTVKTLQMILPTMSIDFVGAQGHTRN